MKKIFLFAMAMLAPTFSLLSAGTDVENCDWLGVNHDLDNTRSSPCTTITFEEIKNGALQPLWSVDGGAVQAAPIVSGNAVFYNDGSGITFKRDITNGNTLASFVFPAGQVSSGPPAIANGVIFVVTTSIVDGVNLYAFDLNLVPIPSFNGGNPVNVDPGFTGLQADSFAGPVITKNKIIVATSNGVGQETTTLYPNYRGGLQAFDATTGAFLWRTRINPASSGLGTAGGAFSSGGVDEELDYIFVGTSNATTPPAGPRTDAMLALDTNTGKIKWTQQYIKDDVYSYQYACGPNLDNGASPNLFEIKSKNGKHYQKVVGASSKKGVYRVFDRKTGKPVWHTHVLPEDLVPSIDGNAGAAYKDGVVYVPGLSENTGTSYGAFAILVQVAAGFGDFAPFNQLINYIRDNDFTHIKALDARDGDTKWKTDYVGCTLASLTEANGVIYTVTHIRGELRAINAKTGEAFIWGNLTPDPVTQPIFIGAPITVAGDYVFVGTGLFPPGPHKFLVYHKSP